MGSGGRPTDVEAGEYSRLLRYHASLLAGRGRVQAYADAIAATVRPGDRVLDLGTGTGVLALLAARAGGQVFAVEDTPAISLARAFVSANGLGDRISLIARSSWRATLSQPADVLVTDTYDSLGLQGGLLGAVIDARRRLLARDARLVPRAVSVWVAPYESAQAYSELLAPWGDSMCGLDFSGARQFALNGVQPMAIESAALIGPPAQVLAVDLRTAEQTKVVGSARLEAARAGTLHGLAGWFEAELAPGVAVSNAPGSATTPYLQAWLPVAEPVALAVGEVVDVRLATDDGSWWEWEVEAVGGARQLHSTDLNFPR